MGKMSWWLRRSTKPKGERKEPILPDRTSPEFAPLAELLLTVRRQKINALELSATWLTHTDDGVPTIVELRRCPRTGTTLEVNYW